MGHKAKPITPLTAEQRQMVEDNIGLAHKEYLLLRRKFYSYDHEEILSLCYLGLTEAARRYNPDKNTSFATYAYKAMYLETINKLIPEKYGGKPRIKALSLDAMSTDKSLWTEFIPYSTEMDDEIIYNLMIDSLNKVVDKTRLSIERKKIFKQWLQEPELSRANLAKKLGVNRKRVDYIIANFKPKAKKILEVTE